MISLSDRHCTRQVCPCPPQLTARARVLHCHTGLEEQERDLIKRTKGADRASPGPKGHAMARKRERRCVDKVKQMFTVHPALLHGPALNKSHWAGGGDQRPPGLGPQLALKKQFCQATNTGNRDTCNEAGGVSPVRGLVAPQNEGLLPPSLLASPPAQPGRGQEL